MVTPAEQHPAGLSAGACSAAWAVCTVMYVTFVSFVWTQVVAGAVVAALAVGLSQLVLRAASLRITGAAPHLWHVRAVGTILARELRAVTVALPARVAGSGPEAGRFAAARLGHAVHATEDAAITVEASIAPNTYVVGVVDQDRDDAVLVVHQFAAQDEVRRSFPRWRP